MSKKIRLKVSVIGPPECGKSSFINNLLQKPFSPNYRKSEGYQLALYKFSKDRIEYEIQLWECGADHMKYNKHIRQAFFKNSSAAFLLFDLTDENWMKKFQEWLSEAYEYDCFLVYAIGTKKDIFFRKKYSLIVGQDNMPDKLTDSLLERNGIQTLDEYQINQFFSEFQIKHFYQDATQPIHKSVRQTFIAIQNDQQKLTRSSLAVGRRFDNTVIEIKTEKRSVRTEELMESVKTQEQQEQEYAVMKLEDEDKLK